MKKLFFALPLLFCVYSLSAQNTDNEIISKIYKNALASTVSHTNLKVLCDSAPYRMVGSKEVEKAVAIATRQIKNLQIDTVYKQEYYTTTWQPKSKATAVAFYGKKQLALHVATLGMSVSTPKNGIKAEVLEVHSLAELDSLGTQKVQGKIVFFNRPMDNAERNPSDAYSKAIDQRLFGTIKAAEHGAKGVIVRSLALELEDFPHTGVSRYKEGVEKIPVMSVSTNDAEMLSKLTKEYPKVLLHMNCQTETKDSVKTCNVIAEIKGRTTPENIIVISAHIDSWYNSQGAHDDGAGCVQIIDVLRIFKELQIRPNNTIRLVLFMDEEINQSGAEAYANSVGLEGKKHIVAIETDAGGFLPVGFNIDASDSIVSSIKNQASKLYDYGIYKTTKGFAGVDIKKLDKYHIPLIGLVNNTQRYFEIHHSANDTFDKVGRRELQLGTAAIASLVYLIDTYGVE